MNNGDTAWLLVSAALVMFMTPGLAPCPASSEHSFPVIANYVMLFT
jgi:hypothetical protein